MPDANVQEQSSTVNVGREQMGTKKARVGYICLEPLLEGHAQYTHVHEIIDGLRGLGWDVSLFDPGYALDRPMPGIVGRSLRILRSQWRAIRSRPGVIYARSHVAAFPLSVWARLRQVPVVHEINGPHEDLFLAWPWTRRIRRFCVGMMRAQWRWAAGIITVTNGLAEFVMRETGRSDVAVIPNAANTAKFHPAAHTDRSLPRRFAVFHGTLVPYQGISTLLAALSEPEWPADLDLVILGDGAERWRVEECAAREPRLQYMGRVPYRDVPGVLAHALVGLAPVINLGGRADTGMAPVKVFEMLSCGIPVIVTDFGFQADLVREQQCGHVVAAASPAALACAVSDIIRHDDIRREMGKRGRGAIETQHSWTHRAQQTNFVLEGAVNRGSQEDCAAKQAK
jgi:glycosyltransferase involved in cell wall biosynthesis